MDHDILELIPRGVNTLRSQAGMIFAATTVISLLLGYIRVAYSGYFKELMNHFISPHTGRGSLNETLMLHYSGATIITHVAYIPLFALLAYEICTAEGIELSVDLTGIWQIGFFCAVAIVYFCFKYILHNIVFFAFKAKNLKNNIIPNKLISISLLSIFILPIVMAFPFVNAGAYRALELIVLLIFATVYLWRISALLKFFSVNIYIIFYLFLYLCTAEAGTIVVFSKILGLI